MSRVNAVGPNWIDLERPLPYNLRAAWKPTVHRFMPMLNDRVGVEGLSMEFAFTKYPGHFLVSAWGEEWQEGAGCPVMPYEWGRGCQELWCLTTTQHQHHFNGRLLFAIQPAV